MTTTFTSNYYYDCELGVYDKCRHHVVSINDLPDDVVTEILEFNGPNDYRYIGATSKQFKRVYLGQAFLDSKEEKRKKWCLLTNIKNNTSLANALLSKSRRKIYESECLPEPLTKEEEEYFVLGDGNFKTPS